MKLTYFINSETVTTSDNIVTQISINISTSEFGGMECNIVFGEEMFEEWFEQFEYKRNFDEIADNENTSIIKAFETYCLKSDMEDLANWILKND